MKICVFCGGAGTRMWPLSRRANPKQFQSIVGEKSSFQLMIERLAKGFDTKDIYVVTGKTYKNLVQKQVPYLPKKNLILEPEMRDTAAAVGFAAAYIQNKFPNEVMAAIWGADHILTKDEEFIKALNLAEKLAKEKEVIVKIDVRPTNPNPNLGYVKLGKKLDEKEGFKIYEFVKHVEKPTLNKAREYLKSGDYLWNTGYLVWRPSTLMKLYKKHSLSVYRSIRKTQEKISSNKDSMANEYAKIPRVSIDYALFEKLQRGDQKVIEADLGWADVGAWNVLRDELAKDKNANVVEANHIGVGTTNTLVYGSNKNKLIATIGLNNMIIVDTEDGLLICPANKASEVKKIVGILKKEKKEKYL